MNKKGFTLIELLATIVILALIGGIASYGVISTINTSKLKSEEVFVDKLSNLIDDYLDLNPPTRSSGSTYTFNKCKVSSCSSFTESNSYSVTATQVVKSDGSSIYLKDLVAANVVEESDLVNPKNKEQCLSGTGPEIIVYKDSDYVYHYYVDLRGTNCDISDENSIINTLPENLKSEVGLS